jgi:hypothetical protein
MNQFDRPEKLAFSPSLRLVDGQISDGRYLKYSWFGKWRTKIKKEISIGRFNLKPTP